MKVILCVLLGLSCTWAAFTKDQLAKLAPISAACQTQSGVTNEEIANARAGGTVKSTEKVRKQALCLALKFDWINTEGEIKENVIKGRLQQLGANEQKINELLLKCAVKKDSPEATAFELVKCFKQYENYFPF